MKRLTRRQFTAAGILAAMSLTSASLKSCNPFAPAENEIETVYGPPEDYDPGENELVDVYGPPEDVDVDVDYDASENVAPCVYGPPPEDDSPEQTTAG